MKQRILIICLSFIVFGISFIGCGKTTMEDDKQQTMSLIESNESADSVTNDAKNKVKVDINNNGSENICFESTNESMNEKILPLGEEDFTSGDIKIFMNLDDVKRELGNPIKEVQEDDESGSYIYLEYEGVNITTEQCNDGFFEVVRMKISNPKIESVRGIKVGDDINKVISKFPNENNERVENIKALYGEMYETDEFGVIYYTNDNITEIVYAKGIGFGAFSLALKVDNNRISSIAFGVQTV